MPIIRPAGCASELPGPGCEVDNCTPSAPSALREKREAQLAEHVKTHKPNVTKCLTCLLLQNQPQPGEVLPGSSRTTSWYDGYTGEFGHTCWCQSWNLEFARAVQVGWCTFDARGEVLERQELCVSDAPPCTQAAVKYHGLTNLQLAQRGQPLAHVLPCLLDALRVLDRSGGVLVGHHIEFDVSILVREFRRLEQPEGAELLTRLAKAATCTMNLARDLQKPRHRGMPSLDWACRAVDIRMPNENATSKRHTALYDAEATGSLYFKLKQMEENGINIIP